QQSFEVLGTDLTKARDFESAKAVMAYREELGRRSGAAPSPAATAAPAAVPASPATISLFDGKTLEGWVGLPDASFFSVVDGAIRLQGKGGDLFYTGSGGEAAEFTDFELTMTVKTEEEANSGVFFHCAKKPNGG